MEGDKPRSPANFQETLIMQYMQVISPKGQLLLKTKIIQKNLLSGQMQSRCSKEGNKFSEVEVAERVAATVGLKTAQLHRDKPRRCEN